METDDISDELLMQLVDACEEAAVNNYYDSNVVTQEPIDTNASQGIVPGPNPEHLEVLNKCFGHTRFRSLQWQIIDAVMNEKRDVCAIMSTGYGKSLCFQYPPIFLGGITIVISPLISLMQDQILSLTVLNIPACLLGSAQTNTPRTIEEIFNDAYNLIYITPEYCAGECGKKLLQRMALELNVVLIAIDEAHCITSWGNNFRVHYRKLGALKKIFPNVPMIAVTATATPKVREDICFNLHLQNPLKVTSGFDRPNLYFEVHQRNRLGPFHDLQKHMVRDVHGKWKFSGPTIIYVIRRKDTEEIAELLNNMKIPAVPYHAKLPVEVRKEGHERFVKDEVQVVVATIAFGMGIDKPDIRNVIHYGCAKSVESYYQEVGRAGRDGLPAKCVTYWHDIDFTIYRSMPDLQPNCDIQDTHLNMVRNYLQTPVCRRRFILNYFEDANALPIIPGEKCCDNCSKKLYDGGSSFEKYEGINKEGKYDMAKDAEILLSAVDILNGRFGMGLYILFVRGSHSSKINERHYSHPKFGAGRTLSEAWWKCLANILKSEHYLKTIYIQSGNRFSYPIVEMTPKGRMFLQQIERDPIGTKLLIEPPQDLLKMLKVKPTNNPPPFQNQQISPPSRRMQILENEPELEERRTLYRKLTNIRSEIARELDCMPYMIVSNTALMEMAHQKPMNLNDLRNLKLDGLTDVKISKFGQKLLEVLHAGNPVAGTSAPNANGQTKQTIQDILVTHNLPRVQKTMTAAVIYSMVKNGFTVDEVANKRGISKTDTIKHLITGIKLGYPIKMNMLGVTSEIRNSIIQAVNKLHIDLEDVKLIPIKECCGPEVTFDHIRIVVAYLQVRHFLEKNKLPYQEFEDFKYHGIKELFEDDVSDENLAALLEMAEKIMDKEMSGEPDNKKLKLEDEPDIKQEIPSQQNIENSDVFELCNDDIKTENIDGINSEELAKIMETDFSSILDSPPRQAQPAIVPEDNIEEFQTEDISVIPDNRIETRATNKKKKMPSWFVTRKIV